MWIVWTGGNDRLWDVLSRDRASASLDLLKTISSHPDDCTDRARQSLARISGSSTSRASRSHRAGSEPLRPVARCARSGLPARSVRRCGRSTRACRSARAAQTVPVGSYYGEPTGVVGLRLFPNPDFDEKARASDGTRSATTAIRTYYDSTRRSCGRIASACRARSATSARIRSSRRPIPRTRSGRTSARTSARSTSGGIAFSTGRATPTAAASSISRSTRRCPGTLDTSLVSTDNINNPRTMNAVYYLGPRMGLAQRGARRRSPAASWTTGSSTSSCPPSDPLAQFFQEPDTTWTPRVLKDGSDSVGALGALNRVYLNIGLFSEEWLLHFRPLLGGTPITPIEIADAQKNSVYWQRHRAADAVHGAVLPRAAPRRTS